jgi:PBP1b-binding outer membrane lipoprotein LpoB
MKKISFIALTLLLITGCKNDTKQAVNEAEPIKKDSSVTKAPAAEKAVEEKTIDESKIIPTLKECTEQTVDYETRLECVFPKSKMEDIYQRTIKEKEVEKAESLLPELPKQSSEKEIHQDGLEIISYKVSPNKVEIEFLFAGGVTTLELEQKGNDVKRTIIHSAD